MLTPTQRKFIKLSMGIDAPLPDEAASAAPMGDVQKIWNASKESTDKAIGALQGKLKGLGHPALNRIAEFGLNGITDGNQVGMMKALAEFNASTGEARQTAARNLEQQAAAYQSFLNSNVMIELVEGNPFGIEVDIKGPMGAALAKIKAVAQAA